MHLSLYVTLSSGKGWVRTIEMEPELGEERKLRQKVIFYYKVVSVTS